MYNIFSSFPLAPCEMGGMGKVIIMKGISSSRTPRSSPSLRKRRSRLSTWSWLSVCGSWWGRSTVLGDKSVDIPPEGPYWWMCMSSGLCDVWAAHGPFRPDTSALGGGKETRQSSKNEKEQSENLIGPQARSLTLNCSKVIIYHLTLCSEQSYLVRTWKTSELNTKFKY